MFGFFDEDDNYVEPTIENLSQKLLETQKELGNANQEIMHLTNAIILLKNVLQENGIEIPGASTLSKPINKMTREEIVERNKETTARSVKHVHSTESIAFPSFDEQVAMYEKDRAKENEAAKALDLIKTGEISLEEVLKISSSQE